MSFTLENTPWADGTEVHAYDATGYPNGFPGAEPPGTAVESRTASNFAVTFTTLVNGTPYLIAGKVSGVWRYIRIIPEATPDSKSGERLDNLAVFNVKDAPYGAQGDGSDDTGAVQAALDACDEAGGGMTLIPPGTFTINGTINVPEGVTLQGLNRVSSVLKSGAKIAEPIVRLNEEKDIAIDGLTIDANEREAYAVESRAGVAETKAVRHSVTNCRIHNVKAKLGYRCAVATTDLVFRDNIVENCEAGGLTLYGVESSDHTGVSIEGNTFRDVGVVNIQLFTDDEEFGEERLFDGVSICNNFFRDFKTPATAIPIEPNGCDNIVVAGNVIATAATRGVSTKECSNLLIANNVIKAQTIYAVELNGTKNAAVVGNVAQDCATFCYQTGKPFEDVLIANNVHEGTGRTEAAANSNSIRIAEASEPKRIQIIGNVFRDAEYLTGVIRLGQSGSPVVDGLVSSNFYVGGHEKSPVRFINPAAVTRVRIRGNTIRIERDLTEADDLNSAILTGNGASTDLTIDHNEIFFTGETEEAPESAGIGPGNVELGTLPGLRVRGNIIAGAAYGLRLRLEGTEYEVTPDNEVSSCTENEQTGRIAVKPKGEVSAEELCDALEKLGLVE